MRCFWWAAVAAAFSALTCLYPSEASAATAAKVVTFPSGGGKRVSAILMLPKGAGPFPLVDNIHGCGGLFRPKRKILNPAREDWAKRFVAAGYAVLLPDSYDSRGVREICSYPANKWPVTMIEHLQDVLSSAIWASRQPFTDKNRIAVVGWGTGGTAVLRALDPAMRRFHALDIKAAVVIYPGCNKWLENGSNFRPSPMPHIFMGAADDWAHPAACKALADKWGSPIMLYPGAYHNFDVPDQKVGVEQTGQGKIHSGTNPAARKAVIKEVMAILRSAFAPVGAGSVSGRN